MRFNATGQTQGGASGEQVLLREETWQGDRYLVAPVVAQQEGVYAYMDENGVRREFVPAKELRENVDAWEDTPLVLRHPTDETGEFVHMEESPDPAVVGRYRNVMATDDGTGLGGEVWIQQAEIGEHGGDLRAYVDELKAGDFGEVSTGYTAGRIDIQNGTYNGQQYSYVQRNLKPDHLALLPDERGNCAVAEGCGVGRANDETVPSDGDSSAFRAMSAPVRVNVDYAVTSVSTDGLSYTDSEWDGSAATSSLPNPSESDEAADTLDATHLLHPTGDEARDSKSNWKLPFRTSADAPANTRALTAAIAAINGARGGMEGVSESKSKSAYNKAVSLLVDAGEYESEEDAPDFKSNADIDSWYARLGRRVASLFGRDEAPGPDGVGMGVSSLAVNADGEGTVSVPPTETEVEEQQSDEPAESGTEASDDSITMEDEEKINELVEDYDLSRENMEALAGTECLDNIYERFTANETESTENEGEAGSTEDPEPVDAGLDEDEVVEIVNEQVSDAVSSAIEEQAGKFAETVETARENKEQVELVAESDEFDFDRERLHAMDADAVSALAEQVETKSEEAEEATRGNFAGVPSGKSVDISTNDGIESEIPVAGQRDSTEGDD